MTCVRGKPWSDAEKELLRSLDGADRETLVSAFPDRTPAAVFTAAKRCGRLPVENAPPTPIDRAMVRARLQALPLELIGDRLPELLERSVSYGRPLKLAESGTNAATIEG